ncbi:hypothetical protein KC19_1G038600 [Ceratodon purpureus]|uniref:BP28 C-terminal domain-containing protein n=1 Tax=Ceratodon purpureus TaxID=3225 RepID=A0A8T0J381_CERPU|nr:hypothetical protein KC19_1G038600 [Ceratodon purpureus]
MASSLALQLEALAVKAGPPTTVNTKTRPSLLFSPTHAADIDLRTIFDLCESGLEELAGTDKRFEAYRKTLFSVETLKLDRELQSRELNEKLNGSISTFLRILSHYILLKPAHQILEYLIRRYKIHVYNVDDILICALPYHETTLFVRIVQLLQLKKTKWAFLERVQKTGAAPTRAALVNQCRSDPAMLDTLCEAAIKVARMPSKTRTIASLTSIIIMEVLAAVPTVETSTVNRILPFVLHSFEGGITEDYRVGALMVVGTLANRASLSSSLVETLIVAMAKNIQKESAVEGAPLIRVSLMVMIQLMQTQALDHFPVEAFKILVKLRVFYELLAKLTVMYDASKLLSLFLEVHVKHCAIHVNYEQSLVNMINTVPLKDYVGQLVTSILQLYMGNVGLEDGEQRNRNEKEVAKHLFQVLERRFSTELDSAVSSCLQNGPGSGKSVNGNAQQQALREIFLGTLHMPLVESNRTLYASLDHPEARVREAAVRRLAEIEEAPKNSFHSEMKEMMWEALFQRAHDDDYGVLLAILSVKSLVNSPFPERVFKMLSTIISKSINTITTGGKTKAQATAAASMALTLLASEFLSLHPSFAERTATLLFGLLLASPKMLKLNLAALKLAREVPFVLYEGLPEIQDSIPEQKEGAKSQMEEFSKLVNEKVVASLAACVLKKSAILLPVLFSSATEFSRNKCLALAVLLRILQEAPKDSILDVLKASVPWLIEQIVVLESEKSFDLKSVTIHQEDYEAAKIKVVAYDRLDEQPTYIHAELIFKIFYQLLEILPTSSKGESAACNDILRRLYELFASARVGDKFSPHLQLLLRRLPDGVFPFLSNYFVSPDFEASPHLHSHSLDLLASYYSRLSTTTVKQSPKLDRKVVNQLQAALPALVVGLASSVQKVRKSAAECLEQLFVLSEKYHSALPGEAKTSRVEVLHSDTFQKVLKALVEAKSACTSNKQYVSKVLDNLLNGTESEASSSTKASRLTPVACKAVVNFFTVHALKLSAVAQKILFSVMKGTGHEVELLGAVVGTLEHLLERRARHHLQISSESNVNKLSPAEVDLLEVILQMYTPKAAVEMTASATAEKQPLNYLFEALKVEGGSTSDSAVVKPCVAALGCLTSEFFKHLSVHVQEQLFQALVELSSSTCADIRAPTQAVLRTIVVPAKVIAAYLHRLGSENQVVEESPAKKKRRVKPVKTNEVGQLWSTPQQQLSCTAALLEVLASLTNIEDRQELVIPLYQLLKYYQGEKWQLPSTDLVTSVHPENGIVSLTSPDYIQQLVLMNLEKLATTLLSVTNPDHAEIFDIDILVQCVADASDAATRNQALMLLTAIARIFPQKVLNHIVDLFSVIGSSTITQDDKYSHDVTQQLLVVVVPFWLKTNKDPTTLLQIIVTALPQVPVHRRMSLVTTLLRVMKEKDSLHVFLMLLLEGTASTANGEVQGENRVGSGKLDLWKGHWEVKFAKDLCQEYEPVTWLPALVKLLKATSTSTSPAASQFITYQLQGLYESYKVHVPQEAFVALLEQVVIQLHSSKIENHLSLVALLDCLTSVMAPIAYLEGLIKLLKVAENEIRQEVLILYTSRMKLQDEAGEHSQRSKKVDQNATDENILKREIDLQARMVSQISDILLAPTEDGSLGVKIAAIEALEKCAARLAGTSRAASLVDILGAVVSVLDAKKKALSVTGVRCVGTLVSILGPRALSSLPSIMTQFFILGRDAMLNLSNPGGTKESVVTAGTEIIASVLKTLGVIVENLGAFLNPYLENLISFLVLHPSVIKASDAKVTSNAAALRELISEKIPARLLLDPLIGTYEKSLTVGHEATTALFDMIASVASRMDRSSVPLYHTKIFHVCLRALDLRCNMPSSFASIAGVEKSVIQAFCSLSLKLSENSFKPLFINVIDWAQTSPAEDGGLSGTHLDRRISFFGLVHQLLEKLRSLFVPYFSFFLDLCISTLTDGQAVGDSDSAKPKKKKKKSSADGSGVGVTLGSWHLGQLVLSSLHKCFLYDTIDFLDSAKFQQLLGPVVAQLVVDPPPGLETSEGENKPENVSSLDEMDDTLVSCVSQMALASGSDLFWKPLNREVLMCTRNKKLRPRLLALRVVKLLAEQLKEEYLVLLPETLPFLAELLEDSELIVVAKSQEIIKILETNSGESLSQYF